MRIFIFVIFVLLFSTGVAFAKIEDPSFYMDKLIPKTQTQKNPNEQKYKDELKALGIPQSVDAFIKFVKKGDVKTVELFLNAGIDVNSNFFTDYPLYFAARANRYEVSKLLLERGANPSLGFNSPLFEAVKNNNPELVALLLEYKTNPNYTDMVTGVSALCYALNKGYTDVANVLLKGGAKVDKQAAFVIQKKRLYNKLQIPNGSP